MSDAERRAVEAREAGFFATHYAEGAANPHGVRERMQRDARVLLRARGGRLGRVLSVGCGEGLFETLLAPHAEHVVGIDIAEPAVARARERAAALGLRNVEFRREALADLAWAERYDGIVCLAFLHHVPEAELPAFLGRAREHLRPGGFLYAQDPNRAGLLRRVGRRLMGARYDRFHSPDERELDPHELAAQVRAAGFERVELGFVDLTLIPGHYLWPRAPAAWMRLLALVDRAFCATPLAPLASGFNCLATVRAEPGLDGLATVPAEPGREERT
jgi:SAM-dependent methyltransferase